MAKATKPASSELIAFQGQAGAYSDMSCRTAYPELKTLPCVGFEEVFDAVKQGKTALGMIPIENSTAGRVAEVHQLLPNSGLHIVAEHFQRVNHHLLACKGATLKTVKTVLSHVQALHQCRAGIRRLGLKAVVRADTAGAAAEVAKAGDPTQAAIASKLAAEIYGLEPLDNQFEDNKRNVTRFIVAAKKAIDPDPARGLVITTFVFRVRNGPAALYKALGGFATNGVNLTKLESYLVGDRFEAAQFYVDVDAHPREAPLRLALEELRFYSTEVKILGTYYAHPYRSHGQAADSD